MTTSSCSAEPSATARAGTASASPSMSRTAPCSAPSTPTSPPPCRSRPRSAARSLALAEHFAGWPLVALTDRYHPARHDLPALTGNHRAFVQATWRHLLFGIVLGELERRLNPPVEPEPPAPAPNYASNGHGSLERAVSVVQD